MFSCKRSFQYSFYVATSCAVILSAMQHTVEAKQGDHTLFCQDISDTSETISCINKEKEYYDQAMLEHYETLNAQIEDEEDLAKLEASQKSWLAYRDTACLWEESWGKGETLGRVYALSCYAKLTQNRLGRLTRALAALGSDEQPEFTSQARWQTALYNQDQNTFWNLSHVTEADMNCDGLNDRIVFGVTPSHEKTAEKPNSYVMALINASKTGAPKIQIIGENISCSSLETVSAKPTEPDDDIADTVQSEDVDATQNIEVEQAAPHACIQVINFPEACAVEALALTWDEQSNSYSSAKFQSELPQEEGKSDESIITE